MIKSLKLSNFQSHDKTELTFSTGVNAIVGCTDSGKSSIIRSLCMAITNKPSGDSCIRNGTDLLSIDVQTDDGKISRAKGKSNQYVVNGVTLKAFGQSVPEEVVSLFRIDPSISIQKQSSPYFLLHSSESERGKLLDKFCNMAIASGSVAMARRSALRADKEADGYKEALVPLKGKKAALDAFLAQRGTVTTIESNNSRMSNIVGRIDKLVTLKDTYEKITKRMAIPHEDIADCVANLRAMVSGYSSKIDTLTALKKAQTRLSVVIPATIPVGTIPDTKDVTVRIVLLKKYAAQLSKAIPERVLCECADIQVRDGLLAKIAVLRGKQNDILAVDKRGTAYRVELAEITAELSKFDVCPLCKNKLGDNHGIHAH